MKISTDDFILEEIRYQGFVRALPKELQEVCQEFHRFLSPAKWSIIDRGAWLYKAYIDGGTLELSITGEKRWAMMKSPHAATLIRIYALQRLPYELQARGTQHANDSLPPRSGNSKGSL